MMTTHYPQPASDEMATAARQALEAADAYHALLLNFAAADYASPGDHQRLDAVIQAAYRHAARIQASRDTGLGPGIGAALAERAAAQPEAPAPSRRAGQDQAGPEAAGDPAGLVIEHHQQGTLVHGTQKNDHPLRRLLGDHGFRWSRNLNAWYLPRPWTFSTRSGRVSGLTVSLRQTNRSFTMRSQPPAPSSADDSPPEPLPAARPYTAMAQARDDYYAALDGYWELTRPPAGNSVMSARLPGARPDAVALDAAYHAVSTGWHDALAGDPQQVADRFTAWMRAASTLSRNLAAEQHRALGFRQALRLHRLRHPPGQPHPGHRPGPGRLGARVRRRPGKYQATAAPEQAGALDPARPVTSSPEAGTSAAQNEQGHPGGEHEPAHAAAPPGPVWHADTAPALPDACRSAAELRQLAEAHGLAAATDRTGGTLTVTVHDQGRTVLLHDDLNGTVAGGRRLNPGQVAAYVAAYASHPQLPPRCLLDLARNDPASRRP